MQSFPNQNESDLVWMIISNWLSQTNHTHSFTSECCVGVDRLEVLGFVRWHRKTRVAREQHPIGAGDAVCDMVFFVRRKHLERHGWNKHFYSPISHSYLLRHGARRCQKHPIGDDLGGGACVEISTPSVECDNA